MDTFSDTVVKLSPDDIVIPAASGPDEGAVCDHPSQRRQYVLEEANQKKQKETTSKTGQEIPPNQSLLDTDVDDGSEDHAINTPALAPQPRSSSPPQESSTWAKVASGPEVSGTSRVIPLNYPGSNNAEACIAPAEVPTGHGEAPEPTEKKAGVVLVLGNFGTQCVNYLTSKIREGPIYSVNVDQAAGFAEITFFHVEHANILVHTDREQAKRVGHGRFGKGFDIVCLSTINWDRKLRKMLPPTRERRRLTFSRTGLLGKNLSYKRFESEIKSIAGPDGLDFLWAFNAGNGK